MGPVVKQTKAMQLRQEQQKKVKERLQASAKKSAKKAVYTSKSTVDKKCVLCCHKNAVFHFSP